MLPAVPSGSTPALPRAAAAGLALRPLATIYLTVLLSCLLLSTSISNAAPQHLDPGSTYRQRHGRDSTHSHTRSLTAVRPAGQQTSQSQSQRDTRKGGGTTAVRGGGQAMQLGFARLGRMGNRTTSAGNGSSGGGGRNRFTCKGMVAPNGARLMPVKGLGPGLFVYNQNDIVSNTILQRAPWEAGAVEQLAWAMQQAAKARPNAAKESAAAAAAGGMVSLPMREPLTPLFVDIGANIGWFTLSMAHLGYTVVAFEGMHRNVQLLRASLCELEKTNASIVSHIRLKSHGLGSTREDCFVYSGISNVGDGHTLCGVKNLEEAATQIPANYAIRGKLHIERLDDVIKRQVQAMKIDIEGYELAVLRGGKQLFTRYKVNYLMTEYNTASTRALFGQNATTEFLRLLDEYGYQVSKSSFQGPWLDNKQLKELAGLKNGEIINLFAAQRTAGGAAATAAPPPSSTVAGANQNGTSGKGGAKGWTARLGLGR